MTIIIALLLILMALDVVILYSALVIGSIADEKTDELLKKMEGEHEKAEAERKDSSL